MIDMVKRLLATPTPLEMAARELVCGMRVLRRTGDDFKWSADKPKSEWDKDDEHHKDAMAAFVKDILELTGTRNYYLDRETLLKMYDMYMTYDTNVVPMWEQNQQALYDKLRRET